MSSSLINIDNTRDCEVWQYLRRIREHIGKDVEVVFDRSRLSDLCLCKLLTALRCHHVNELVTMKFIEQRLTRKALLLLFDFHVLRTLVIHSKLSGDLLILLVSFLSNNRLRGFGIHDDFSECVSSQLISTFLQTLGIASNIKVLSLHNIYIRSECQHAMGFLLQHSRATSITLVDVSVNFADELVSYIRSSEQPKINDLTLSISPKHRQTSIFPFYMILFENLIMMDRLQSVKFVGLDFQDIDERFKSLIEDMRSCLECVEFVHCRFSLSSYNTMMSALCDGYRCKILRLIDNVIDISVLNTQKKTKKKIHYYSFAHSASPERFALSLSGVHAYSKLYLKSLSSDLYTNESITDLELTLRDFPRGCPRALPFFSMNQHIQKLALYGQWPANIQIFGDDEMNTTIESIHCATLPRCAFSLERFPALQQLSLDRSDVRDLSGCPQLKRLSLQLSILLDRHLSTIFETLHSLEKFSLSIRNAPTTVLIKKLQDILERNPLLDEIVCQEAFIKIDHVIKRQ